MGVEVPRCICFLFVFVGQVASICFVCFFFLCVTCNTITVNADCFFLYFSMLAGADLVENMVVKEKTLRDRLAVLNNREQAMVAKLESVQQELDEIVGSLK